MKKLNIFILLGLLVIGFTQCKKEAQDTLTGCAGNVCSHSLTSAQTAGTVAASTHGLHSLTLQYAAANSPYPNGTTGEFEITTDNKLVVKINGDCITLTNPYQTSSSEVVYVDNCKFNLNFAVSESSQGGLNEINIASLSGTFYGQFN